MSIAGITIVGVDEVVESVLAMPGRVDARPTLGRAAEDFAARLRAATPIGYSGRLPASVLTDVQETSASVGFDVKVEDAGRPELDAKRKSVLFRDMGKRRWITAGELDDITGEALSAFVATGGAEAIEAGLAKEVERAVT